MRGMWLGIALVVWLWGVALYLVVYYAALLILGASRLYELLGQDVYNVHVPLGGWRPALREGLSLFAVDAPIPADVQHLWGGATTCTQYLDVVRVESHACWVREGVHRNWRVPAGLRVVSRDPHPPAAGW